MPKNNRNQKKRRSSASRRPRNNRASNGTTAPPRLERNLPQRSNPTYCVTRAIRRNSIVTSTTIDGSPATTMQYSFSPGATDYRFAGVSVYTTALPNVSEFSALFDQWRLKKVIVRIDMPAAYSNSGNSPGIIMPCMYFVSDYDDSQDCTITDMLQYPQCRVHNFYKDGYTPFQVSLSPKPLRDVAGSGIATSYGPMPTAPWLRTADLSTPHYGLKVAFDWFGYTQLTTVGIVVTIWYELEFTNPK